MVDRIHDDAADRRPDAAPALRAGLAVDDQAVVFVADFADRRATVDVHLAHLGRPQTDRRVEPFARHELCGGPGAARELTAPARLELDVVDLRADRNVADRQRVACLDRGLGARLDRVACRDALRREDVTTLAVCVEHERDVRVAVGVVLESLDLAWHAVLRAAEVDDTVALLMAAALVPRREPTLVVARARALLARRQRGDRATLVQV